MDASPDPAGATGVGGTDGACAGDECVKDPESGCLCGLVGGYVGSKNEWRSAALTVTLREYEAGAVWVLARTDQALGAGDIEFLKSVSELPDEAEASWVGEESGTFDHVFVVIM